jgi:hypothetical protein
MRCTIDVPENAVVAYYELHFNNYLRMMDINHEKHQDWKLCALKKCIALPLSIRHAISEEWELKIYKGTT